MNPGVAQAAQALPPGAWLWLAALAAVAFAAAVIGGWLWGARCASRARLVERADRNGRALLELADEIELYLWQQRAAGTPVLVQQHWPRMCRRAALAHLECINELMLERPIRD